MVNKKTRRHSGRYTPNLNKVNMPYSTIKEEALEPEEHYDDWLECRDGFRDSVGKDWKNRDKKKRDKKKKKFVGGKRK